MSNIIKSASKIVFIIMAVGALALTILRIISGEQFVMLTAMAFSAYYGSKIPKAEN